MQGDVENLKGVLQRLPPPQEPVLAIVVMRARGLVGDREQGCALAGEAIRHRATRLASFRRDAVLAAGYCAMAGGNAEARKLTADLIHGEKLDAPFALAVLEGAGAGGKGVPRHCRSRSVRSTTGSGRRPVWFGRPISSNGPSQGCWRCWRPRRRLTRGCEWSPPNAQHA